MCGFPLKCWSVQCQSFNVRFFIAVQEYADGQDMLVRSLAGPRAGERVACRKQNQNVIGPDGKLFLPYLSVKPLAEVPDTLPKFIFHLPSPAMLANGHRP
jgi:hypothetical protein